MAVDPRIAEYEAELKKRGALRVSGSVLEAPGTTYQELGKFAESAGKGTVKGLADLAGIGGTLFDYLTKGTTPSAMSSRNITNQFTAATGIDPMQIRGYEGMYKAAEAAAPQIALTAINPSLGLFSPVGAVQRTVGTMGRLAAEGAVAGGVGLAAQQVAPDSAVAQIALQTLPYLVKGGVSGLQARGQQKKIDEYRSLLPAKDANTFSEFMLRGQGSSDPFIAADIARLSSSPKYLELINALNEGASAKAVSGMAPKAAPLTAEQSKVGIIQSIQNKLEGIRDSKADSLFEKAKGYGAGQGLVDPTITLSKIDGLIGRYSAQATPNAERAVEVLTGIRDRLSPSFTTQGSAGTSVSTTRKVTGMDAAGMPIVTEVPTNINVPGAQPYNVQRGPQKLTVEQVQGLLSEFGKKASAGDNLIKDLSISDERIISSAIFGGMKDDLASATKTATGNDKAALNLLNTAREKVSKASVAYNDAIAQGMPAFLQNKTLSEISPEQLFSTYSSLTPSQRATMRSWVSNTDEAALSVLDKQVFDNFVSSAKMPNATGIDTIDLATLAKNWRALDPIAKDSLVTALGTNSTEFGKRMSDAEVMTRKMRTNVPGVEATIAPSTVREASAVLGAGGGYGVAKVGQLSMDLVNSFTKNGLTEDQIMKALMTPEGASFLKNAAISPRSATVLEDLTKMEQTNPVLKWMVGTEAAAGPRAGMTDQPTMQQAPQQQEVPNQLQELEAELQRREAGAPQ